MKILSMDVGDRRIGMAVSDDLGWTAQGIATLERRGAQYDLEKIRETLDHYQPDRIVVGLPRNMNGTLGPQGEKVMAFAEKLKSVFGPDIVFWDERLTTVSAHKAMIEGNLSRQKRKKRVDRVAAVLILQSYLDFLNRKQQG